jgi:hypothetical protein
MPQDQPTKATKITFTDSQQMTASHWQQNTHIQVLKHRAASQAGIMHYYYLVKMLYHNGCPIYVLWLSNLCLKLKNTEKKSGKQQYILTKTGTLSYSNLSTFIGLVSPQYHCSYKGPSETARDSSHQILRVEKHTHLPHQGIMNHLLPRKVK